MNRSSPPKKQPLPFGTNGQRENLLEDTPAGDNTASYSKGFPPVTMILKAAGGLPPKGQDMNQILFELSDLMRWASTGAINSFDPAFSSAISGYPSGALVLSDAGDKIFISIIDNNTDNPNSTNTGSWKNAADFIGVSESVQQEIDGKLAKTGTAAAAIKLETARTIGGVSFDGTANINLPGVNAAGNQSTTGNAATATKLATARTINGVTFDGTANITFPLDLPVGSPVPYPLSAAPTGWLKCNGQTFDTAKYPVLASRYLSGQLPDLRGEFIRGWDDGRKVDVGRNLLSAQGDAIRNITGSQHFVEMVDGVRSTGVFKESQEYAARAYRVQGDGYSSTVDFDASRVVPTADENRPRNIAFNYIVRAA